MDAPISPPRSSMDATEIKLPTEHVIWRDCHKPDTPPPDSEVVEWLWGSKSTDGGRDLTHNDRPVVAVIGIGYVGLHLVTSFAEHYSVVAFDVSEKRLESISGQLKHLDSVILTSDPSKLAEASHFLVSVPTLLCPDKSIDTSYLRNAIENVGTYARAGATIVIESSVAVGMTRQLLAPLITSKGLKGGMSPERVDPGRISPPYHAIPKIISGLDDLSPGSLSSIMELYNPVFNNIVQVSSPEVAEMTKLYENCQRMICIAYANEMADACLQYGIDAYEVSDAASTKPFGYIPFRPGLGVGGHCIPVNPYYLLSNEKTSFPLLEAATEKMWTRPSVIGDRIMSKFQKSQHPAADGLAVARKSQVLVVGAGFKKGQSSLSNSPGVALMNHLLEKWEAHVTFADPLVEQDHLHYIPRLDEKISWTTRELEKFDIIVVAVEQVGLDLEMLAHLHGVIVESF